MAEIDATFERFLKEDITPYKGKWITISAEQGVVSADGDLKKAIAEFKKKFPDKEPLTFKVPKEFGLVVYGGFFLQINR